MMAAGDSLERLYCQPIASAGPRACFASERDSLFSRSRSCPTPLPVFVLRPLPSRAGGASTVSNRCGSRTPRRLLPGTG